MPNSQRLIENLVIEEPLKYDAMDEDWCPWYLAFLFAVITAGTQESNNAFTISYILYY